MEIHTQDINAEEASELLETSETHFVDIKSAKIAPAKLTKTISAFANTSGGEIFLGIDEYEDVEGKSRVWAGYPDEEAANAVFQVMDGLNPLGNNYSGEYFRAPGRLGLVLHLTIFKTQDIVLASDGKAYIRRNAQNLPIASETAMERLRYDKGIKSFEDELVSVPLDDIINSSTTLDFLLGMVPTAKPTEWLTKQRVLLNGRVTVAGALLYSDLPQVHLPKRSAVKIYGIGPIQVRSVTSWRLLRSRSKGQSTA